MSSFVLRKIDPEFWTRVQTKATADGITIKALLLKLLTQWLGVLALALAIAGCRQAGPMTATRSVPARQGFQIPAVLLPVLAALDKSTWVHPLIGEPMGYWVRKHVAGIVLDASLPPAIGARFDWDTHLLHWQPLNTPAMYTVASLASLILHEARHGQGYRHSCGAQDLAHDRTMEEGGAFAVQILYLEHEGFPEEAATMRQRYIGC